MPADLRIVYDLVGEQPMRLRILADTPAGLTWLTQWHPHEPFTVLDGETLYASASEGLAVVLEALKAGLSLQ